MLSNYELKQKLSYIILGQRGGQSRVQIIESLVERPYNINQLAEKLDLNYRTVRHHIDMLLRHGLIGTSRTGGYGEVYFVSPELETRLPLFREIADKLETITASPKFLQNVIEQTNDAVLIVDGKLDVIFWNRSAEALFGHSGEEVLGGRIPVFPDTDDLRKVLAAVAEGKKVVGLDTRARTRAGGELDLQMTVDGIRDEGNHILGYSIICQDVTERKLALDALLLSQQRYALAQQAAGIISWDWDVVSDGMSWSERPGQFLGLGPAVEIKTFREFLGYVHPEDRALVQNAAGGVTKRGREISMEHRVIRPDGQVRWVRHTGGVIRDDKGKPRRLLGIIQDVTGRRDAERRYARVLETSLDGFWINDMKGRFLEVNDAYCRIVGYGRRQLLGMAIKDVEAAEKPADTMRHIQKIMREGSDRFETRHRRKDGSLVDLEVSATFLDAEGGRLVVFLRDITQRKRAEAALRLSEQRYALAQKAAAIGSWDWDIGTGALEWSDTIEPMFGFEQGKFKGTYKAFLACVHPDDRKGLEAAVQAAVERKRPYNIEHRIAWPDGSVRWMSERGEVLRDERGRPVRMLGVVQDITERKRAEEKIRHLATFPQLNPSPVLELDLAGNVVYRNAVASRLLREAGARGPAELRPADLGGVLEELRDHPGSTVYRDVALADRVFSMAIFQPAGLPCYRIHGVDITDRKRAEEELARKDRMAALGRLAGGAGHELSVPLTAIKNAAYYLRMAIENPGGDVVEALDIMGREVGVSERIISNLLDLAGAKPVSPGEVVVPALLDAAIVGAGIPPGVKVLRRDVGAVPSVTGDAGQLELLFHNLLRNAVEAMPDGGSLEVGSRPDDGGGVAVSIRDTGKGIPAADLPRIFDPLFTTKARGIGLGLTVARTLAGVHGGSIEVRSRAGEGTTFTVRLPPGRDGGGER